MLSPFNSSMLSPLLDDFTEICRLIKFRNFIVEFSYTALNISCHKILQFSNWVLYSVLLSEKLSFSTVRSGWSHFVCTYWKVDQKKSSIMAYFNRVPVAYSKPLNYKRSYFMAYFSLCLVSCVFRNNQLQTILPSINMSYSDPMLFRVNKPFVLRVHVQQP
jgi:hypothetical protein